MELQQPIHDSQTYSGRMTQAVATNRQTGAGHWWRSRLPPVKAMAMSAEHKPTSLLHQQRKHNLNKDIKNE